MKYEMQCGHVQEYHPGALPDSLPDQFMPCQECGTLVKLSAIECREWRYDCRICRFRRWSGQSQAMAVDYGTVHYNNTGHDVGYTDYSRIPALAARVRNLYGYQVKIFIIDTTVIGIRHVPDTREFQPQLPDMPEEPPF